MLIVILALKILISTFSSKVFLEKQIITSDTRIVKAIITVMVI